MLSPIVRVMELQGRGAVSWVDPEVVLFNAPYVIGMQLLTIKTYVHCSTIEVQDNVYVSRKT
jgi:hypothetical protein